MHVVVVICSFLRLFLSCLSFFLFCSLLCSDTVDKSHGSILIHRFDVLSTRLGFIQIFSSQIFFRSRRGRSHDDSHPFNEQGVEPWGVVRGVIGFSWSPFPAFGLLILESDARDRRTPLIAFTLLVRWCTSLIAFTLLVRCIHPWGALVCYVFPKIFITSDRSSCLVS